ncbi:hypothetical protein HELRODRAFT_182117 [Helobdella robusta]|uniref:Endonuclease/exonuclease/phosphatase domain-containing protein n=1 Tax=Helobdella robusta TaxID=6412 RepID=T1FHS2_HELRO|nr:hypothetical protein HELRODRAFT_182117 [Helobdella robusta]ESN91258.1 hypothetical protein HELRODRAFT_182117 [Helobdella robusta]
MILGTGTIPCLPVVDSKSASLKVNKKNLLLNVPPTLTVRPGRLTTLTGSGATAFSWWSRLDILTSISRVFSPSEQTIPASLLRCLLLRAGIESNPGPPKIWICPICNMKINKTQYSARCRSCCNWCYLHDCSSDFGGFFICKNCPSPNPRSSSSAASAMSMRHSQTSSTSKTERIISHPAYQNTTGFVAHSPGQLTFLQWNCNGTKNKKDKLQQHLETHKIHIAALQETKLTSRSKEPEFDGYSLYRKDRGLGQGGGLNPKP